MITQTPMEVRDYELDIQGIVNNAVYLNYLEHARHQHIKAFGLDFNRLHAEGWDPVVVRAEVDYRQSLQGGDRFVVSTRMEAQGKLRFVFVQEIHRADGVSCIEARITATTIKDGRPRPCPLIQEALEKNT